MSYVPMNPVAQEVVDAAFKETQPLVPGFRLGLLVESLVVVELKSVEKTVPIQRRL